MLDKMYVRAPSVIYKTICYKENGLRDPLLAAGQHLRYGEFSLLIVFSNYFFSSDYAQLAFVCSHSCEGHFSAIVQHQLVSFLTVNFFQQDVDLDYVAKVTHGFSGADLTEICQRVRSSVLFTTFQDIFAVIHLEIGSNESRDAHSQKLVSPSDKKLSPTQHFSSFPVQNALMCLWNVCSFVTRQFHGN